MSAIGRRSLLEYALFNALYWPTVAFAGWPWWGLVLALYMGYCVGSTVGHARGLEARGRIIAEVHGEDWVADAVRGRMQRMARETAPWN